MTPGEMDEMMLEIVRDLDLDIHDEWPFLQFVEVLLNWRSKKGNDEKPRPGKGLGFAATTSQVAWAGY